MANNQSEKLQGNGAQNSNQNFRENEGYNQGEHLHFIDNYLDISNTIKKYTEKHEENGLWISSPSQVLYPFCPVHPYTHFRESA